jgi:3-oxoacyl-[acyl-carrier-protein] synthase II
MAPGPIPPVTMEDVFPEPNLRFGRLPQYSRVGLAAVALALRDAGMDHWETKRSAGIVASTRTGCLATDIEYYNTVLPEGADCRAPTCSPAPPYLLSGEAAIQFGLTGPTLIVNDPAEDALGGVRMALELLLGSGRCWRGISISRPNRRSRGSVPRTPAALQRCWRVPGMRPRAARTLDLSGGGAVRHDGIQIADLNELVRACLAFPRPS